ncbi:MAG: hypothetical protein Q3962_03855 [Corynebacterium sp.]|nr:hypothetical protein [Corynebacterium sp.]
MDFSLIKTQLGDLSAFFSGVHALIKYVPVLLNTIAGLLGSKSGDALKAIGTAPLDS